MRAAGRAGSDGEIKFGNQGKIEEVSILAAGLHQRSNTFLGETQDADANGQPSVAHHDRLALAVKAVDSSACGVPSFPGNDQCLQVSSFFGSPAKRSAAAPSLRQASLSVPCRRTAARQGGRRCAPPTGPKV